MRRLALFPLLFFPALAHAQDAPERFTIEREDDGYVRMDTQTGAMSLCREEGERLICRMAADDRDAMLTETERMHETIAALEARIAALESAPAVKLPTDQDIERSIGVMERFVRGFVDATRGTEPPTQTTPAPAEPVPPAPDRTALP